MKRKFNTKSIHRLHLNCLNNNLCISVRSVTSFAERDATPDAQKEITQKNELYEAPTSCDTLETGTDVQRNENNLYEVPTLGIKIAERDSQKTEVNIEMKDMKLLSQ